jgi:o-succinylbenzoate synthase
VFLRAEREGVTGWGECGAIPGLSPDDSPDYVDTITRISRSITQGAAPETLDLERLPSIAFGLETALRDLETGGRQRLFDTSFSHGEAALPTHGLIWMGPADDVLAQVDRKVAAGCRVIKLKVGALPFEQECALLSSIRRRHPGSEVELRLDANGAFTPDEALDRLDALAEYEIAFLEQPIRPGQTQAMATLCARSPIPIALDEELIGAAGPGARRKLLELIRPQHVILKPSLLGGLAACEVWIEEAERIACCWWINSLLESNVGLNAISQWTSAIDPVRTHGLGTGQLFANNIPSPLRFDGCGLRLDPGASWEFGSMAS